MAATESMAPGDVPASLIEDCRWLVLDGNLSPALLGHALRVAELARVPVALDPVSAPKAGVLAPLLRRTHVHTVTPTLDELVALTGERDPATGAARLLQSGVEVVWMRDGDRGSTLFRPDRAPEQILLPPVEPLDVTGAGDAMLAAYVHELVGGGDLSHAAYAGAAAASLTVRSTRTVRSDISETLIDKTLADAGVVPLRAPGGLMTERTSAADLLRCSEEVRDALAEGRPVLALESTIISHGMPYPDNVAMAREVEQIVRGHGVTPATIAVLDGVPRIGLDDTGLELLASEPGVRKVSIRDLPYVVARREHGATTVASTMRLAALAGIRVFTTGGLGGVHRGAATSYDVSADLTELSRTAVTVVSAGVKSILDIALTLEMLETLGVPVLGYRTDEFPAFYTRSSGHPVPLRVDSAQEVADQMRAKDALGLPGGISVANPIPEADEIPHAEIDTIIDQALADLDRLGITGKDITPYLLGRIVEITGGASLTANIALVRNNAHLGAEIATAFASTH
jgi:pseudouridine-5'-phosphate glycosidase